MKTQRNILEFNVGDTKTNQQTASKVDCKITINNRTWKAPDIELKDISDSDNNIQSRDINLSDNSMNKPLRGENEVPSAERYSLLAKTKPILREDLINNHEFKDTIIEIYKEILSKNDKELLANLLDLSGKIIISSDQLVELVAVAMNLKKTDIHLKLQENILSSCCKVKVIPFKNVLSITAGTIDLKLHQYEVYSVINEYVSVDIVYSE